MLDEAASVSKELAIGGRDGKEGDFKFFVLDKGVNKDHQAIGRDGKDPPPAMENGQKEQQDMTNDKGCRQEMHQFESLGILSLEHHTGLTGVFYLTEEGTELDTALVEDISFGKQPAVASGLEEPGTQVDVLSVTNRGKTTYLLE